MQDNKVMMMRLNKKGLSPIGLLGEILVVLAVIIILLAVVIVPKFFSTSEVAGAQIGGLQNDADKDGIRNFVDKCPCTFGDDPLYDGCPATFDDTQRQDDVKKYNSKPVCGIVVDQTTAQQAAQQNQQSAQQKPAEQTEQKPEPAAFKKYQSIEIFGDGIDEEDLPKDGIIKQACTGWIGSSSCPSEDNDCDGEFSLEPLKDGCWAMASEDDDTDPNDCGQARVDNGKIIPLQGYRLLSVDNYQSKPNEDDPRNLFQWAWKSKAEYGALICNNGFWHGCDKDSNEGQILQVHDSVYKCLGGEWIKQ